MGRVCGLTAVDMLKSLTAIRRYICLPAKNVAINLMMTALEL